jgi:3-phosphoshikimate 1-carboxyvinyltransferase
LRGATLDTKGDHRVLMAFAVAGLVAQGETRLTDPESAAVSYPAFVGHFKQLGAAVGIEGAGPPRPLPGPAGGGSGAREVRA